jgi:hypothetical protein
MGHRAKHTKIWAGGYVLSTKTRDIKPTIAADELEESGYLMDHSTLKGQFASDIALDGYYDPTTGSTHDALKTLNDTAQLVSTALGENATPAQGDISLSLEAEQINYEINPALNDVIAATGTFKARGNPAEFGILLADQSAVSSDSNTSSVDQTAQSTAGAVGYLHLTAVSAGDTLVVKIQDSANNTDWADLITFTLDGTAVGAERSTVSGTVDRYVRVLWDVTGTGVSFDFAVMFVRK